jgi:hypothetical protein
MTPPCLQVGLLLSLDRDAAAGALGARLRHGAAADMEGRLGPRLVRRPGARPRLPHVPPLPPQVGGLVVYPPSDNWGWSMDGYLFIAAAASSFVLTCALSLHPYPMSTSTHSKQVKLRYQSYFGGGRD